MTDLSYFKAYDVRGRIGEHLNDASVYAVGRAFIEQLSAKSVVIGFDARPDSERFAGALKAAALDMGAAVVELGLCGTEEVYFNTDDQNADLGLMVTASHNPIDYNGIKYVGAGAKPITDAKVIDAVKARVAELLEAGTASAPVQSGAALSKDSYIAKLRSQVNVTQLKPLKIVANVGNGTAGLALDKLRPNLPFEMIVLNGDPDPTFPKGIPNPLLPEKRAETRDAVLAHGADLGIAWDGDFDRCFFFDAQGRFIEGYYVVALIARAILSAPHAEGDNRIIYDPRLTWATQAVVEELGGEAIRIQSGHSFIKEGMRAYNAVYGGEMSAHHYFREFSYCDTGMLPWLFVAAEICRSGQSLAELADDLMQRFPCSGEINFRVDNADDAIARVEAGITDKVVDRDLLDGLSLDFGEWRMNIRKSNTEPLLRLNIEARGDADVVAAKVTEVTALIEG